MAAPSDPSGGNIGNPGANQGGGGGDIQAPQDPWSGIDPDDLPPEIRTKVLKAKEAFATLQTQQQQAQQQAQQAEQRARQFQSNHDRLQQQLQTLTSGGNPNQPQADPKAALVSQIEKALMERGVPEAQAKLQAPIHADLLSIQGDALRKEIGAGLAPMANMVLSQNAQNAWTQVSMNDKLGAFQIPEVAQATWENVQHMLQGGQEVTPQIIDNLRRMNYMAHLEANGGTVPNQQQQQQQQQQQVNSPQFPNMSTRFTFPGAGNFAHNPPPPVDKNAPKTNLNADTQAALAATFAKMHPTIRPKAFGGQ